MGNTVPIVLNQLVALVLGVVGVAVLTRLVPPEVNGHYQVHFLSLCQLGVLLTHPGLVNHASRYWQRESERAGTYSRFLWKECWLRFTPLLLMVGLAMTMVAWKEGSWWWMLGIPVVAFCNVVVALETTARMVVNAGEEHWRVLWLNLAGTATRLGLPLAAAALWGSSLAALGIGFAISSVLMAGMIGMGLRGWSDAPRAQGVDGIEKWHRELVDYGRPFLWLGLGSWMLQFADRWLISMLLGEAKAGLFATASSLSAYVPNVILGAMMQKVFPSIFRECDAARDPEDWKRISIRCGHWTLGFVAVVLVGLLLLDFLGPRLLQGLLGSDYRESWSMILPSGMAAMTLQINQFHYLILQGQHNSMGMVRVMMAVAGLKTAGSALCLLAGWDWFVAWLWISMPLCAFVGRGMILRMALRGSGEVAGKGGPHG
ncbi:MAG: hypothetical protein FJ404_17425 [Verrucomicrobia bacterium]|nr:hypothetical protein [Verrucomicrobiota bacterium]